MISILWPLIVKASKMSVQAKSYFHADIYQTDHAIVVESAAMRHIIVSYGRVAEWFKAAVLKTVGRASVP